MRLLARAVSHFAQKLASNFVQHSRLTSSHPCDTIESESEVKSMMTVKELIEVLKNYDEDLDVAVAFGEEDGVDFKIEASDLCVFFVGNI